MDFLDQVSHNNPEFLVTDVFAAAGGGILSIQGTLSQDRAAGAHVWEEDGALHTSDIFTTRKNISEQILLPGDQEILQSGHIFASDEIADIAAEQLENLTHREAARIVRAQLVKNRPYLTDPTEEFLDWSSYLKSLPKAILSEWDNPFAQQNSLVVQTEDQEMSPESVSEMPKEVHSKSEVSITFQPEDGKNNEGYSDRKPSSTSTVEANLEDSHNEKSGSPSPSDDGWGEPEPFESDTSPKVRRNRKPPRKYSVEPAADPSKDDYMENVAARMPLGHTYRQSEGYMSHFIPKAQPEVKYAEVQVTPAVYCIVCEIKCSNRQPYDNHRSLLFEDVPFLRARSKANAPHLEGTRPIQSLGKYLKERGASFVVLRTYCCSAENLTMPVVSVEPAKSGNSGMSSREERTTPLLRPPKLRYPETYVDLKVRKDIAERLHVISEPVIAKIQKLAAYNPGILIGENDGQPYGPLEMHFPYLFLFHHQSKLRENLGDETDEIQAILLDFLQYGESCQGDKFQRAAELFSRGKSSHELQDFLFETNGAVVCKEKDVISAYMLRYIEQKDWGGPPTLDCWSWCSNGTELKRKKRKIDLRWPKENEYSIDSLEVYPLKYASQTTRDSLLRQGKNYWNLRHQHKVAYSGWDVPGDQIHYESRFMIDQRTYNRLHPNSTTFVFSKDPVLLYDEYPSEIELNADVLDELDYILCPHVVQGFYLKEKHWVSLYVNKVEEVKWNKEAFDRLVLPPKTKELIKALLLTNESTGSDTVGICGGKRQDLIAGKGTGLIVLLHGGPGTGKTLTAESVAELAEKPLYSVTCGDIGTEPDAVESYLRRVMYFGKTWNCVLLLDEADVFLEERGLQDLKRNSLVSIFLRILEYYSGILILTSNRVGSFDEAFKSRIQLALRYPDPDPPFRQKIWRNFFDMLEADQEDADLDELKEHIEELSELDMNGREIRNALTTARQLALYKKKTLAWVHLNQAVNAARDFNKYLMDVQGHSNKDWARELSLR